MTADIFRFLHVSDLHLCAEVNRKNFVSLFNKLPSSLIDVGKSAYSYGPRSLMHPASYRSSVLSGLSEFVYSRPNAYDGILLSGDVVTSGTAIDHNVAFNYLDTPPDNKWRKANQPVLSKAGTPLVLCPGNHDNYTGNDPAPVSMHFSLKFGKYLPNYTLQRVGYTIFAEHPQALAVIYGDFGFQTKSDASNRAHLYGGGRVHSSVLNDLVAKTVRFRSNSKLKSYSKHVIWMIHFAPFQCKSSVLDLTDRHLIVAAAKNADVSHIICGHTHESSYQNIGGVNIYCSGSATSVDCDNEIHELVFDANTSTLSKVDYIWSKADGEFMPKSIFAGI